MEIQQVVEKLKKLKSDDLVVFTNDDLIRTQEEALKEISSYSPNTMDALEMDCPFHMEICNWYLIDDVSCYYMNSKEEALKDLSENPYALFIAPGISRDNCIEPENFIHRVYKSPEQQEKDRKEILLKENSN